MLFMKSGRCLAPGLLLLLSACFPQSDHSSSKAARVFNVSGTLHADNRTLVDSDVNDPLAPYVGNDSPQRAQQLPNPFTVGGYLNLPQHGTAGDSFGVGDVIDVFRVALEEGQTLTLSIGDDPKTNDLDLLLVNDRMEIVDGSFGVGRTESLTISAQNAGNDLYVAVVICGSNLYQCDTTSSDYVGATTYTLDLSTVPVVEHGSSLTLGSAFVPGEIVARYAPVNAAKSMPGAAKASTRPQLLRVSSTPAKAPAALRAMRGAANAHDTLQHKLDTLMAVKSLRRRADVTSADLNYVRTAQWTPNDTAYRHQWHYDVINLPRAWDVTRGVTAAGTEPIVAVIDTGVLVNHPDLKDRIVAGYDFIATASNALDGDGMDADGNDPGDRAYGSRSTFHGTHVAGTVAAAVDNTIGGAGISAGAKIMPLRVLGKNGGTSYDVMQAVLFAAGLPNDSGTVPARRADIINLSLAGGGFSKTEQDAFTAARAQGVIIVAAAGNGSSSGPAYPASYAGVISVSAVDSKLSRTPYSNYGALIDVAAPGGSTQWDVNGDGQYDGIFSTSGNDYTGTVEFTYTLMTGTSMAAPHIAGVLALMKAVNPGLTPDNVDALLASGALTQDLGTTGRDNDYGYGMIDAYKAVAAASGGQLSSAPMLVAFPSALNFGALLGEATLAVVNGGGAALAAQAPTVDVDWIGLDAHVDANGLGSYTVRVDRSNLKMGSHTAVMTITSDAGTVTIPVYVDVDSRSSAGESARYQWIVLVDAHTGNTADATQAVVTADNYEFVFHDVVAGDYYAIVGSDLDNDGYICDGGEACGAYTSNRELAVITISDSDVTNLWLRSAFGSYAAPPTSTRFAFPNTGVTRTITRN